MPFSWDREIDFNGMDSIAKQIASDAAHINAAFERRRAQIAKLTEEIVLVDPTESDEEIISRIIAHDVAMAGIVFMQQPDPGDEDDDDDYWDEDDGDEDFDGDDDFNEDEDDFDADANDDGYGDEA